jgi:PPOX class probable F420-dependent enzyme
VYTRKYTSYIGKDDAMFSSLAAERYISLTTFRKDGTPVATPVWVVTDDGRRLLVWSGAKTWKVRRIRRNPRVLVAAASVRGKERGRRYAGRARVVPDPGIAALLREKYGWQKRALDLLNGSSKPESWATMEIVADDA